MAAELLFSLTTIRLAEKRDPYKRLTRSRHFLGDLFQVLTDNVRWTRSCNNEMITLTIPLLRGLCD